MKKIKVKFLFLALIMVMVPFFLSGCLGGWVGGSYGFSYNTQKTNRTAVWSPNQEQHIRAKKETHTDHTFSQNWGNWGSGGYETHEKRERITLDPIESKTTKHTIRIKYPD